MTTIQKLLLLFVCTTFAGCATNVRFAGDTLPSGRITGEKVCEVPQGWKASALQGIDTRSLTKATVVQVKVPPEWMGDSLGWFVEGAEERTLEHYPRHVWQALVIDQRGKKQFVPAIMRNPLESPVLTVVITDPEVQAGDEVSVYVPSGAYTKLLTTTGDMLRLPNGKDCLGLVDVEFLRSFPSPAVTLQASESLLTGIRRDYSKPSLQSDGVVYSIDPMVLNPRVVGALRQVRQGERIAERGMPIAFPPGIGTAISIGVALASTGDDEYAGPFGERQYSPPEVVAALARPLRGYNSLKERLEITLGLPATREASIRLDFEGRKSGWEIGEMMASQVTPLWETLSRLKERFLSRTQEKGALLMNEASPSGLLPSSSP